MSFIYFLVSVGSLSARRNCSLRVSELGEWTGISHSLSHNRIGSPITGFRLSKELDIGTRPGIRTWTWDEGWRVIAAFQNLTVASSFAILPQYMKQILCVRGAGCSLFGYVSNPRTILRL